MSTQYLSCSTMRRTPWTCPSMKASRFRISVRLSVCMLASAVCLPISWLAGVTHTPWVGVYPQDTAQPAILSIQREAMGNTKAQRFFCTVTGDRLLRLCLRIPVSWRLVARSLRRERFVGAGDGEARRGTSADDVDRAVHDGSAEAVAGRRHRRQRLPCVRCGIVDLVLIEGAAGALAAEDVD